MMLNAPLKPILLLTFLLGVAVSSYAQVTATQTPGTTGATTPVAPPVLGEPTSFTTTVSFNVTNNTQTQQIVRVEAVVQDAQTGQPIASGTSGEKTIPAGQTRRVDVTITSTSSTNETSTGRKDATTRANVRQGATIIHPESWGFTYDVATRESGGGNFYEM